MGAGSRLMDVVVAPRALLDSGGRLRLNAQYYITKQINAALARVLQLVGVDVSTWWVPSHPRSHLGRDADVALRIAGVTQDL